MELKSVKLKEYTPHACKNTTAPDRVVAEALIEKGGYLHGLKCKEVRLRCVTGGVSEIIATFKDVHDFFENYRAFIYDARLGLEPQRGQALAECGRWLMDFATDPLETVSDEEWEERERVWNGILTDDCSQPSHAGMTIRILDEFRDVFYELARRTRNKEQEARK